MTKLSKEDFIKKFQNEVWAYCEAYAKQEREEERKEIIEELEKGVKFYENASVFVRDESIEMSDRQLAKADGVRHIINILKNKDD